MKKISLMWKLIITIMIVVVLTTGLMAVLIRLNSQESLSRLIIDQQRSNLSESLVEYYSLNGSWEDVTAAWDQLQMRRNSPPPPPAENRRKSLFGLADENGMVTVSSNAAYPVGSTLPPEILSNGEPLILSDKRVGTILTADLPPGFNPEEYLFLERTNRALFASLGGALLVALVLGILLARTLIYPLKALTEAANLIAEGNLEQQVQVNSKDEIGQLASAFNLMSKEVSRVNGLRRQMTADIAHDLRTPLTTIAGYIESMQEGVLKPTPERLALIYSEIEVLQNLVGDLRMLSRVDAGDLTFNCQNIAPGYLLERASASFQQQAEKQQITIKAESESGLPDIFIDEDRMMRVLGNLISNALRFTPSGGLIQMRAKAVENGVEIEMKDNGSGISPEELPFLFDRMHRIDKARSDVSGETGLGLAIVKALVIAQGGSVQVSSKLGEGTTFTLEFPAAGS
ncbi:MAG: sensor histidine kinase [Anaerolineaceae bacterium]